MTFDLQRPLGLVNNKKLTIMLSVANIMQLLIFFFQIIRYFFGVYSVWPKFHISVLFLFDVKLNSDYKEIINTLVITQT